MAPPFRKAKNWVTKRVIPDYTNQLDLFSEAPDDPTAPLAHAAPPRSVGGPAKPQQQQLDFGEWGPIPADYAPKGLTSQSRAPEPEAERATDPPSLLPPATVTQDGTAADRKSRDRRDPSLGRVFDIEPEERPSRDFRINEMHRIGQGSLHEKARDNIAAIRLLKVLEAEDRDPSDD